LQACNVASLQEASFHFLKEPPKGKSSAEINMAAPCYSI